jgi:hypothetical protein
MKFRFRQSRQIRNECQPRQTCCRKLVFETLEWRALISCILATTCNQTIPASGAPSSPAHVEHLEPVSGFNAMTVLRHAVA